MYLIRRCDAAWAWASKVCRIHLGTFPKENKVQLTGWLEAGLPLYNVYIKSQNSLAGGRHAPPPRSETCNKQITPP